MGADDVTVVQSLQLSSYLDVVIMTVVGYDYFLTFSEEVQYIWCRPWTLVSTLFLVLRYVGLSWAIILALVGSIVIHGPIEYAVTIATNRCGALFAVGDWTYILFLAAADLMVLRVYAMWGHSKVILVILLSIYVPLVIVSVVWEAVYYTPNKTLSVSILHVADYTFCGYSSTIPTPSAIYRAIPRFVLGPTLLILAVIPTLKYMVEMRGMTGRWSTNRPLKLLVKEGAVYFIVNLLFNVVASIDLPLEVSVFLNVFSYSLSCTIMPRFIISIRELYSHDDYTDYWRGSDTWFGVLSKQTPTEHSGISMVVLADLEVERTVFKDKDDSRTIVRLPV